MSNAISELSREEIVVLGMRNRAGYLLEQAGYTLGLARIDGPGLEDLAPAGFLEAVAEARDRVRDAMKEKALLVEESKGSTVDVNTVLRRAKEWRRDVVNRCKFAGRTGKRIPEGLTRIEKAYGVPQVATSVNQMTQWLESCKAAIPGKDVGALIKEGKDLFEAISATDAIQETKRAKHLSDAAEEFYYQKGLLYTGLKGINDLGRSLHRGDPSAINKYNMAILYRNAGKKKKAEVPVPDKGGKG
jgi:hypothetical protein